MFKIWMVFLILKQTTSSLGYNPYDENFYYDWQHAPVFYPYDPAYQPIYQNNFSPARPFAAAPNMIQTSVNNPNYQPPRQPTFQRRLRFQQNTRGNQLASFPNTNTDASTKQSQKSGKLQLPSTTNDNQPANIPARKVDGLKPELEPQQNENLQPSQSSQENDIPSPTSVSMIRGGSTESNEFPGNESISPEKRASENEVPLSEAKCREYYPESLQSVFARRGFKFITAGEPALPGEFTFMAALGWETITAEYDYKCGGSLISEQYVLTAAHCTSLYGRPPAVAKLGGVNLNSTTDGEVARVVKIHVHPNYSQDGEYDDIALIQLDRNASLKVIPACVWREQNIDEKEVKAIGYGHTVFAGPKSNELLKVNLTLSSNEECGRYFPPGPRIQSSIIGTQLCAGDPRHEKDTCQGDSGGPLLIHKDLRSKKVPYIIGITSVGLQCAGMAPSIYTRISEYIDWIESVVWP